MDWPELLPIMDCCLADGRPLGWLTLPHNFLRRLTSMRSAVYAIHITPWYWNSLIFQNQIWIRKSMNPISEAGWLDSRWRRVTDKCQRRKLQTICFYQFTTHDFTLKSHKKLAGTNLTFNKVWLGETNKCRHPGKTHIQILHLFTWNRIRIWRFSRLQPYRISGSGFKIKVWFQSNQRRSEYQ